MSENLKVLLATEGTYPFHEGGVSTWCHTLVNEMKSVDYIVYSVMMNPFVTPKYKLPANTELLMMPLWGTEEPSEHLKKPFSEVYLQKQQTTDSVVEEQFIPLFTQLISEFIRPTKRSDQFGDVLLKLHLYFQENEYKVSFKSEITWEAYKQIILDAVLKPSNKLSHPDIYGLIQSLGWIYRFLNIVNTPVPKVQVTHSAAAAFCGIPCVLAKLKDNTPFLLTEHGVYMREQYLSLSKRNYSTFLNTFLTRFIQSIVSLNYYFADQISPVCEYNTRWERRFGVSPKKIQVIYNGVDQQIFKESVYEKGSNNTVVMVARIDPIKDILSFIKAAHLVKKQIHDAQFVVYGSVSVPDYFQECLDLVKGNRMEDYFKFGGHIGHVSAAYHSGDVIALSSISEAFPYSVVEAMMSGKAVIATDVGGVKEALGDAGILVHPRDVDGLANGMIKLLVNPALREAFGQEARQRALNYFTLNKMVNQHLKAYIKLASRAHEYKPQKRRVSTAAVQKLYVEKAYALASNRLYQEAIKQYKSALVIDPNSLLVPIILTGMAEAHNKLGQYDQVFLEMDKAQAFMTIKEDKIQHIS